MKDATRPEDRFVARITALERAVRALRTRPAPTPSATRPDAAAAGAGTCWYDPATHRPSWSDGAVWRYADGSPV